MIAEGKVVFESLQQTDVYEGQDTGKYTLTLTLDDKSADELSGLGVKLKDYEGKLQRKFSTKNLPKVVDIEGEPFKEQLTRGSLVRVQYATGKAHNVHGTPVYLNKLRVLDLAEGYADDEEF